MIGKAMCWGVALVALIAFSGCSRKADQPEPAASSLPAPARSNIQSALAAYEAIRAELARDQTNVRGRALELAGAATLAHDAAPEALRPPLQDLSASAQTLATLTTEDKKEVRKAFGEVSRAVVALLAAEPSLQPGRHLYECPMAEGYKKWVQVDEKIANPYMGSQMLECGAEAKY